MSDEAPKAKKTRAPSKPKPLFIVFQVLDESGSPVPFPKEQINVVMGSTDAGTVLEAMDSGKFAHATYKVVDVTK